MLIKLIIAIALLYVLFKGIKAFQRSPKKRQKQRLIQIALIAAAGVLLLGVVTGRMHWVGAIIAGLLPFLRSSFFALMRFAPFLMKTTGGKARFKTEYLAIEIDIARRGISGQVIKGPHEGTALNQLSEQQLQELVDFYQTRDKKSLFFIRALQKGFSEQSSAQEDFSAPDRIEALQILGLKGTPSKEEIIHAHRRLINKLHPDRGGSDFLASRVNQARDTLLKNLGNDQ